MFSDGADGVLGSVCGLAGCGTLVEGLWMSNAQTEAPALAKACVITLPMPPFAPVTQTTLPWKLLLGSTCVRLLVGCMGYEAFVCGRRDL